VTIASAGTVEVDFAAEVVRFNKQLESVNKRLGGLESGLSSLDKVAQKALGFLSVAAFTGFIKGAADAADATAKLSDKLGISTERLAALDLAASDAGVSTETLAKLLSDAQRKLGEAAGGTGATADAIAALGLNIRELRRLSPDELFLTYADALGKVKSRSDQFALAQDLVGKSSQQAFALIAGGRDAVEAAAATVEKLGLALNRVDAAKIEEANDKLGLLSRTSQAFGQKLAASLAPFISEFVDRLTDAGISADDARSKLDTFATAVFVAFELVANAARVFDAAVSGAFAAFAATQQAAFRIAREGLELTASLDSAVGLDSLAAKFEGFAQKVGAAEAFSAALAEQAAARVKSAADGIKSFADIFAEADRIVAESQARAEAAAAAQAELAAGITGESNLESLQFQFDSELELRDEFFTMRLQQEFDFLQEINKIRGKLDLEVFENEERRRVELVQHAEQQILAVKQGAANAALGLLQVLASRNKAAALALIAVEKIRAIAQAKINTAVAVTNALANVPYPYNLAAASQVATLGAVQIGLIVATGLAEAANVLSSPSAGAALGSPQNPVFTDSNTSASNASAGATQNKQIHITLQGVVTAGAATEIARALKDVIDGSDVILFGSNSAQAAEIRGD
jgi:hypothetical protein